MGNRRRIVGVLTAILLATVGTLMLVGYVRSARDEAVAEEALVDVYVVDAPIPKGAAAEVIRSSVAAEQVPARLVQDGALTDLDDIGDQVAATDLLPGDQLVSSRLGTTQEVTEEVPDAVQVAARLSAERAVGGALRAGDLVGVYLSFEPFELDASGTPIGPLDPFDTSGSVPDDPVDDPPSTDGEPSAAPAATGKTPNVTRLEFQQVLVTNVQTAEAPVVPSDDDAAGVAQVPSTEYIVTLALSPEESERFVFAAEFGHVWLSIQPATVSDDGTRLVTLGDVYRVVG